MTENFLDRHGVEKIKCECRQIENILVRMFWCYSVISAFLRVRVGNFSMALQTIFVRRGRETLYYEIL
jgi:hypothetical protein